MSAAIDFARRADANATAAPVAVEELRERSAISALAADWTRVAAAMRDGG